MSDDGDDNYSDNFDSDGGGGDNGAAGLGGTGGSAPAIYSPLSDKLDATAGGEGGESLPTSPEPPSALQEEWGRHAPGGAAATEDAANPEQPPPQRRRPSINTESVTVIEAPPLPAEEDGADDHASAMLMGGFMNPFMNPFNPMGEVVQAQQQQQDATSQVKAASDLDVPPQRPVAEQLARVPAKSGIKPSARCTPPPREEYFNDFELGCVTSSNFEDAGGGGGDEASTGGGTTPVTQGTTSPPLPPELPETMKRIASDLHPAKLKALAREHRAAAAAEGEEEEGHTQTAAATSPEGERRSSLTALPPVASAAAAAGDGSSSGNITAPPPDEHAPPTDVETTASPTPGDVAVEAHELVGAASPRGAAAEAGRDDGAEGPTTAAVDIAEDRTEGVDDDLFSRESPTPAAAEWADADADVGAAAAAETTPGDAAADTAGGGASGGGVSPVGSPPASVPSPTPQCPPPTTNTGEWRAHGAGGAGHAAEVWNNFGRLVVYVKHLHGYHPTTLATAMESAGKTPTNVVRTYITFRGRVAALKPVAVSNAPQDTEKALAVNQEAVFNDIAMRADHVEVAVYSALGSARDALARERRRQKRRGQSFCGGGLPGDGGAGDAPSVAAEGGGHCDSHTSTAFAKQSVEYLPALPDEGTEHCFGRAKVSVGGRAEIGSLIVPVGANGERVALNWFYQYQPTHTFGMNLRFRTAAHLATGIPDDAAKNASNAQDTSNKTQTTFNPCVKVCSGGVPTVYTITAKAPPKGIPLNSRDVLMWGSCRIPVNTRRDEKVYLSLWDEKKWNDALATGTGNRDAGIRDTACYGEVVLDAAALVAQFRAQGGGGGGAGIDPAATQRRSISPPSTSVGAGAGVGYHRQASPVPPPSVHAGDTPAGAVGAATDAHAPQSTPLGGGGAADAAAVGTTPGAGGGGGGGGETWTWVDVHPPGVASVAVMAVEVVAYQEKLRANARNAAKLWERVWKQTAGVAAGDKKVKRRDVATAVQQARVVSDLAAQQRRQFAELLRHAIATQLRLVHPEARAVGATPFPGHRAPRGGTADAAAVAEWLQVFPLLLKTEKPQGGKRGKQAVEATAAELPAASGSADAGGAVPVLPAADDAAGALCRTMSVLKAGIRELMHCAARRRAALGGGKAPAAKGSGFHGLYGPTAAIAKRIVEVVTGKAAADGCDMPPEAAPTVLWLFQTLDFVLKKGKEFTTGNPDTDALTPLLLLLLSGKSVPSAIEFEGELFKPLPPQAGGGRGGRGGTHAAATLLGASSAPPTVTFSGTLDSVGDAGGPGVTATALASNAGASLVAAAPATRGFGNAAQFPKDVRCVEAGAEMPVAVKIYDGYGRRVYPKHSVFLRDALTHEIVEEVRLGNTGTHRFRKAGTFYLTVRVEEVNYLSSLVNPDGKALTRMSTRFHVCPGPPEFLQATPTAFESTCTAIQPTALTLTDRCGNVLPAELNAVSGVVAGGILPPGAHQLSLTLKRYITTFPWEVQIHGQPESLAVTAAPVNTAVFDVTAALKDTDGNICTASREGWWVKFVSVADATPQPALLRSPLALAFDAVVARDPLVGDAVDVMLGKARVVAGTARCRVVAEGPVVHKLVGVLCRYEPAFDRVTREYLGSTLPLSTPASTFTALNLSVASVDTHGVVDLIVRGNAPNDILHPREPVSIAAWDASTTPPDRLDEVVILDHRTDAPLTLTPDHHVPSIVLPYPSTFHIEVTMKGVCAKVTVEFNDPNAKQVAATAAAAGGPGDDSAGNPTHPGAVAPGPRSPTNINRPALIMDRAAEEQEPFVQHVTPLVSAACALVAPPQAASRMRVAEGNTYAVDPQPADTGREIGKAYRIGGVVVESVDRLLAQVPPVAAPGATNHLQAEAGPPGFACSPQRALTDGGAAQTSAAAGEGGGNGEGSGEGTANGVPPCYVRVEVDLELSAGTRAGPTPIIIFEPPPLVAAGSGTAATDGVVTTRSDGAPPGGALAMRGRKTVAAMDPRTGRVAFPGLILRNVTQYPVVLKFTTTEDSRVSFAPCYLAFQTEKDLTAAVVDGVAIAPQAASDPWMSVAVVQPREGLPPFYAWYAGGVVAGCGKLAADAGTREGQLAALHADGIRGIVNLVDAEAVGPPDALDALGIQHLHIPTRSERAGIKLDKLAAACVFIESTSERRDNPGAVVVMCDDGGARTGLVCAAWAMWSRGRNARDAIAEARCRRSGAVRSSEQEQQLARFGVALKSDVIRMSMERGRFDESEHREDVPIRVKLDRDTSALPSDSLLDLDVRIRLRLPLLEESMVPPKAMPKATKLDLPTAKKPVAGQWLAGTATYRKKSRVQPTSDVVADPSAGIPQGAVLKTIAKKPVESYKVKSELMQAALQSGSYDIGYAYFAEPPRKCLVEVRSCATDHVLVEPFYTTLDPAVVEPSALTYSLGSVVVDNTAGGSAAPGKQRDYMFRTRCSVGEAGWVYIRAVCVASRMAAVSAPVFVAHGTPAKVSIHPTLTPATAGMSQEALEALAAPQPGRKRLSMPFAHVGTTAAGRGDQLEGAARAPVRTGPARVNSGDNPCLLRAGASVDVRFCLADARGVVFPNALDMRRVWERANANATGGGGGGATLNCDDATSAPRAAAHDGRAAGAGKILVRIVHCNEEEGRQEPTADAVVEAHPAPEDDSGLWWTARIDVPSAGLYTLRATYMAAEVSPKWDAVKGGVIYSPCGTPPAVFAGDASPTNAGSASNGKATPLEGVFYVRAVVGEAVAVRYREHGVGGDDLDHIGVVVEAVDAFMQPTPVADDVKIDVPHVDGEAITIAKGEQRAQVYFACGENPAGFRAALRERVRAARCEGGLTGVWCGSEVYCPAGNPAAIPAGAGAGAPRDPLCGWVTEGPSTSPTPTPHYNLPCAKDAAHFLGAVGILEQIAKRVVHNLVAASRADTVAVCADATLKTTEDGGVPMSDDSMIHHRNKAVAEAFEHARRAMHPILKAKGFTTPPVEFTLDKAAAGTRAALPVYDPDDPPTMYTRALPASAAVTPRTYGRLLLSWTFTADTTSGEVINALAVGGAGSGVPQLSLKGPPASAAKVAATAACNSPRFVRDAVAHRAAMLCGAEHDRMSPAVVGTGGNSVRVENAQALIAGATAGHAAASDTPADRTPHGGVGAAAHVGAGGAGAAKGTRGRVLSIDADKRAVMNAASKTQDDTLFRRRLPVPGVLVTVFSAKGLIPASCIDETRHVYIRLVMGGDWAVTQTTKRETLAPLVDSHFCFTRRVSAQVLKVQVFAKKKFTKHDQFLGEAFVNCGLKMDEDGLAHGSFVLRPRMAGRHAAADLAYLRLHQRFDYGTIQIAWSLQKPSKIGVRPQLKAHGQNIHIGQAREAADTAGSDADVIYTKLIQRVEEYRRLSGSHDAERIALGVMSETHKIALARLASESKMELILSVDREASATSEAPQYCLEGKEACFQRLGLPVKQVVLTCAHCKNIFCHEFFHFCQKATRSEHQSADVVSQLKRVWLLEEAELPSYGLRSEGFGAAKGGGHGNKFTALIK